MNDNVKEQTKTEEKKDITLEDRLKGVSDDLAKVKSQIQQVEQQLVQNQRQLQARKDALLSAGLELQGQEKLLKDILGIKDSPVEVKVVETKKEDKAVEESAEAAKSDPKPAPTK